jgi:hypothetical protein
VPAPENFSLDGAAFQTSLVTRTVSRSLTSKAYNFTNEGTTLIVMTPRESVAELSPSISSAEEEFWQPQI